MVILEIRKRSGAFDIECRARERGIQKSKFSRLCAATGVGICSAGLRSHFLKSQLYQFFLQGFAQAADALNDLFGFGV
ncbi:MAG: hypothetical protein BWY63_02906 [Chloroflexi bacterium ADurb.Bin360]|nr:MAG: hypothetical protein BWY63_02906 [Chloroflexi bacterium ADurb.Bin360]